MGKKGMMSVSRGDFLRRLVFSVGVMAILGCGQGESRTAREAETIAEEGSLWVHAGSESTKVMFDSLPKVLEHGEEVIQLNEFISEGTVPPVQDLTAGNGDSREHYVYEIVGEDGFSPWRYRGYPHNTWDQMHLGYLIPKERQVIFPDEKIDLYRAYDVSGASHINVHPKSMATASDSLNPDVSSSALSR